MMTNFELAAQKHGYYKHGELFVNMSEGKFFLWDGYYMHADKGNTQFASILCIEEGQNGYRGYEEAFAILSKNEYFKGNPYDTAAWIV